MRYLLFAIFLALAAGLASARAAEYVVEPRVVPDRKAVFGRVESVHQTEARARIAGTLVSVSVVEGDRVKAGERIALVKDPKLPLKLAETDARLKSLAAQQAKAKVDLERMAVLRKTNTASQAQYDQARTALDVVTAEIAAMQAERDLILEEQKEGAVLAPVSGRVLTVNKIAGTVIMPGESVATLAEETYILRIYLPQRHARFIKVGDPVEVGAYGLASTPSQMREGRVRLVYPELKRGRVVADVTVEGLGNFYVGERTRVYVATGQRKTYVVPATFVFRRFGVYFVRIKGLGEVVVQVGQETPQGVEVLSGLRPGDILVAP
jgi:multidrug efflux system membrane fusion protein